MIEPVNGHLLIEPVEHESFIAGKETYEEVGVVYAIAENLFWIDGDEKLPAHKGLPSNGDKIFFDSWLAAKYPTGDGKFFWLVKWDDVRAVEKQNVES